MKIAIIGSGNVGSAITYGLICRNLGIEKIALIDIIDDFARGKAFDLSHAASAFNSDISIIGGSDYEMARGCDIVVITAGKPRKIGQSRSDLLKDNTKVVFESARKIAKISPNAIIIVVTNPLDKMVYAAMLGSKFSPKRVLGMAGELDSARLRYEISKENGKKISQIKSCVLGTHDENMQISWQDEVVSDRNSVEENTKNSGAKINELSGNSAYYAPAAGTINMIEAILRGGVVACSVCFEDEKTKHICGRLVRMGRDGVSELLDDGLIAGKNSDINGDEFRVVFDTASSYEE